MQNRVAPSSALPRTGYWANRSPRGATPTPFMWVKGGKPLEFTDFSCRKNTSIGSLVIEEGRWTLACPTWWRGRCFTGHWIWELGYRLIALDQRVAGGVEHPFLKLSGRPVTPSPEGGRASSPLSTPAGLLFFFGVKLVNSICARQRLYLHSWT